MRLTRPGGQPYTTADVLLLDGEIDSLMTVRVEDGLQATVLRGTAAARFLDDVESGDDQELMARVTGNYRRGNERMGKNHPRNQGR